MKRLLVFILTTVTFFANGQSGLQYKLELYLDATFDQEETKKIKRQGNPTIEFMGLNDFTVDGKSFDTLTLEKRLAHMLIYRQRTKKLTILDSKNRLYEEHVLIVGQLHRVLLRVKDSISTNRFGVEYEKISKQEDINSIDRVVPLDIMIVDKTHWR
jgi:hypothetical protein